MVSCGHAPIAEALERAATPQLLSSRKTWSIDRSRMLEEKIRTVSECGGHCWQTNELGLARSDALEWDENENEEDGENRESLESSCLDRVSLMYVY